MSEIENTQQPAGTLVTPPDVAQNTENRPPEAIPYSRFQEVNNEKKKLAEQLQKLLDAEKERTDAEAIKRGDFQTIIDTLKPKAERTDALEATLKIYLQSEIESLPQDISDLIPEGDVTTQLAWIKRAKANPRLYRTPAPNTDAGAVGDPKPPGVKLSDTERALAAQFGMTEEQYAKFKR
jgi:phage I-like protein